MDDTSSEKQSDAQNQDAKIDEQSLTMCGKEMEEIVGQLSDLLHSFIEPIFDGDPNRWGCSILWQAACICILIDSFVAILWKRGSEVEFAFGEHLGRDDAVWIFYIEIGEHALFHFEQWIVRKFAYLNGGIEIIILYVGLEAGFLFTLFHYCNFGWGCFLLNFQFAG